MEAEAEVEVEAEVEAEVRDFQEWATAKDQAAQVPVAKVQAVEVQKVVKGNGPEANQRDKSNDTSAGW